MTTLSNRCGRCLWHHWQVVSRLWIVLAWSLGLMSAGRADEPAKAYVRSIAEIQSDLDAGRIADAKKRLAATDESLRNFEFQYLNFRAEGAAAEGTAAPDGIRKLSNPEVETRYGVLNPFTRQVIFICRDGSLRVNDLSKPDAVPAVTQDQPLFNAGPFGNYVVGLSFTPDGKRIAATGCENVVRLFDAATGEVMLSLKRSACSAKPAFSNDGRLLGWNEPEGFLFIDVGATVP